MVRRPFQVLADQINDIPGQSLAAFPSLLPGLPDQRLFGLDHRPFLFGFWHGSPPLFLVSALVSIPIPSKSAAPILPSPLPRFRFASRRSSALINLTIYELNVW